jgi:RNA polymerase sigma-70 factor (ECF subfamily)
MAATSVDDLVGLRGQITAHCYRMLGSAHEAEDAVQETMVRAWRGLAGLHDPSGLRPWLYKIATNVCLDALAHRNRRALPMDLAAPDDGHGDVGTARPESEWVQPLPTGAAAMAEDPVERAVARESIRLAFVAALQHLLPRQRAVLILRDVLRWRAAEVADLLDTSVDAVNSTLRRARTALAGARDAQPAPPVDATVDPRALARYVDAFERFDVDRIVALLREDAVVSMPPYALWLRGGDAFGRFLRRAGDGCRYQRAVLTEANGCPAVALYRRGEGGALQPAALHALEWRDGKVAALHAFHHPSALTPFALPSL